MRGFVSVFGQMEADASHPMPFRRPRREECGQSFLRFHALVYPLVETPPSAPKRFLGQVFAALDGWGGQHQVGPVGARRRFDLEAFAALGNVAKSGEVTLGELLPVPHARRGVSGRLVRRQGEKGATPIGLEGVSQARALDRGRFGPRSVPAQTASRCQLDAHVREPYWRVDAISSHRMRKLAVERHHGRGERMRDRATFWRSTGYTHDRLSWISLCLFQAFVLDVGHNDVHSG